MARTQIILLAGTLAMLACDSTPTQPAPDTELWVINATSEPLNVVTVSTIRAGNGNIQYGGTSRCMAVNPDIPGVTIREAASNDFVGQVNGPLVEGRSYAIIVSGNSTGFNLIRIENAFSPATGMAGVRVVNTVPGVSYDVHITTAGATLNNPRKTNLAPGTATDFIEVPTSETQQIRLTDVGGTTVEVNLGTTLFAAGDRITFVVAPEPSGTVRYFAVVHREC